MTGMEDEKGCRFCESKIDWRSHKCRGEKIGFEGSTHRWGGRVIVPGQGQVYSCFASGHAHRNRDQSNRSWGTSATDCARHWLRDQQLGNEHDWRIGLQQIV